MKYLITISLTKLKLSGRDRQEDLARGLKVKNAGDS